MARYILKRILALIPILIAVSFLVFFIMDLAPGTAIDLLGSEYTLEQKEIMYHQLGYDRSVFYRYAIYMKDVIRGDLGQSFAFKQPIFNMYMSRLPATAILAFSGLTLALIVSVPLGVYAARHAGSLGDTICSVVSLIGVSMPRFWLGLMLIMFFSLRLGWFPSGTFDEGLRSIVLPAITIALGSIAQLMRTTRSSMLDVLGKDYLDTARSKGTPEKKVVYKHAFRNALIPILTVFGTSLGNCLAGAVVTENVFTWPGIGRLTLDALNQRDTIAVTGCIVLTTFFVSVLMLLVDLMYAAVDPRIKSMYIRGGKKK